MKDPVTAPAVDGEFPTMDRELVAALSALPGVDFRDLAGTRQVLETAAADQLSRLPELSRRWEVTIEHHRTGGGVAFLLVRPATPTGPAPAMLWLHGGGFAVGAAALEAAFCAELAAHAGVVVAVPDYRLAPEHPYPAGLDDSYSVLQHLHHRAAALGVDPSRLGVGGQSAGGGLAVAASLLARDRGEIAVRFLAVESPELDDRLDTGSMRTFTATPVWTRAAAMCSWQHYLGSDRTDVSPYAAPARATDLTGLPPTYLTVAELDPLRDEGLAFATRLLGSGVSVELHAYPGTFHRSSILLSAAVSRRARTDLVDAVARGLHPPCSPTPS
jgi:acetyl esterase